MCIPDAKKILLEPKKPCQEHRRTSALDNCAFPTNLSDATTPLPPATIYAEFNQNGTTANPTSSLPTGSILFRAMMPAFVCSKCSSQPSVVLMCETLHFDNTKPKISLTTKLTFEAPLTYEVRVKTMSTATNLIDIGAAVNLGLPSLISVSCKIFIRCRAFSRLHTTTGHRNQQNEMVLLLLRLSQLWTRF